MRGLQPKESRPKYELAEIGQERKKTRWRERAKE